MKDIREFNHRIELAVNRLNKQREFLKRATDKPEILFDKASTMFTRKDDIFSIMNVYEDGQRKMNVHDLQAFLCSIINNFFRSELKDERITIKVRDRLRYPSIFAVYYDDNEFLQFDIFERYYGKRMMKTVEEIEEHYKRQADQKHKELEIVKEKISDMLAAKDNPIKYIINYHKNRKTKIYKKWFYGSKELVLYVFQWGKMSKLVGKALDKYAQQLEEIEARYKKYDNLEFDLKNLRIKEDLISKVEPIFIKYNYRLETENHKLY
ncbi:hypothetical protein [Paenibacillus sp. XY044]|uniref:hypothetical protein n=1 Tax=Paenibacillus sp. XY044 TaxID=2026089 RepID=UPI000B97ED10|nr:hypothetical protein [Paenibacillus sp. XY044]OZB98136.1 hypothetical protein CJP46_02910 [Paenibacillus sp. XY044]